MESTSFCCFSESSLRQDSAACMESLRTPKYGCFAWSQSRSQKFARLQACDGAGVKFELLADILMVQKPLGAIMVRHQAEALSPDQRGRHATRMAHDDEQRRVERLNQHLGMLGPLDLLHQHVE